MVTVLVIGATLVAAALAAAVSTSRRHPSGGQVARRTRRAGADPYDGQRRPEKLNPGLGGFGSGGGG